MNYCPNCGKQVEGDAAYCSGCGQKVSSEKRSTQARIDRAYEVDRPTGTQQGGGFGVAALVLSLVGLLINPLLLLGVIFGAVGLSGNRANSGLAWTGLIISVVGIIAWIIAIVWLFTY